MELLRTILHHFAKLGQVIIPLGSQNEGGILSVDDKRPASSGDPATEQPAPNDLRMDQIELEKQKEELLRYRTLVEWTPDPLFVHRDGKFLYANPAAVRMFGALSANDLVGTAILDRIHPDFHEIVLGRVKHFLEHGGTAPMIEEKMLKLDGSVIDVEGQGTIISYDGAPAVQVVMHDITERKRVEAALTC